jgi:uncharacterized protein (DUF3084 family)
MKNLVIGVAIVLGIGLAAAVYFCIMLSMDKNALAAELGSIQSVLATTQAELTTTKNDLAATQVELEQTKETLTSTNDELNDTQVTLASTESELETTSQELTLKLGELDDANGEIDSLEVSLEDLQDDYANTSNLLDISQQTLEGLGMDVDFSSECRDVELVDNPAAVNPSLSELRAFLAEDLTEQHEYLRDVYDCSQFSRDVHNNAEAAGIQAAEVQLWFKNADAGHALNAFITTDYGLVYVDCTSPPDTIARVKLDKDYRAVDKYSVSGQNVRNDAWWDSLWSYYYLSSDTGANSIVSEIMIYW